MLPVSHLHADHCLDLCGYYVLRKYHPDGPQPRIPVWGPEGTADRMARAYDLPVDPGMTEEFDFREYAEPVDDRPVHGRRRCRSSTRCRRSACGSSAGGATLGYTGDTGPCDGLDEVAAGADMLLAEASFLASDDNPPDLHLTGTDCGGAATRGGVEPAGADPHAAVARPERRGRWPTAEAVVAGGPITSRRARGATWDVLRGRSGETRVDARRSRSAPGW